ncbi:MAG: ROK family protein [Abditibacteriaceae bacterium]
MSILGIDLGGTTFKVSIVDDNGQLLNAIERDTQQHDPPEELIKRLADAAREVAGDQKIDALGIGVPGPIRPDSGVCVFAPNLNGWTEFPVGDLLREQLGFPISVINDANAAALGEAHFGAGRNVHSMLMLTLGTGVGSGIVQRGKLLNGFSGRGAELGHISIKYDAPTGTAGNFGTLESECGRDAIINRALRLLADGHDSIIPEMCDHEFSKLTPEHISRAAEKKDVIALQVWDETAAILAAGIVNTVYTVDVERVVIGGGVSAAGKVLFDPLRRAVLARTSHYKFDVNQIVQAELGNDAGLVGAAVWAKENMNK